MRGLGLGARALAVAVLLMLVAGCGGPRGFYASGPPRVPAGGVFAIEPGQDVVVYGVRARRCSMAPPTFETASQEMFSGEGSQAPEVGEVYDAGEGQRVSVPCGGSVPVRAIGFRAPADFEGEVTMVFYGADQTTITVARPPEPEPEPEAAPEVESAPEAEPAPEAGAEPAPESSN